MFYIVHTITYRVYSGHYLEKKGQQRDKQMSVQFGKLISRIQQSGSPSEREGIPPLLLMMMYLCINFTVQLS